MSVDFWSCHNCGETFPDCGEYVSCESCGTVWCCDECAEEEGYIEEHCKKWDVCGYDDLNEERKIRKCDYEWCDTCPEYVADSCKYCRGEDYEDSELLDKALELLKMKREDLVDIMNKK
jgi:hypothetical protein